MRNITATGPQHNHSTLSKLAIQLTELQRFYNLFWLPVKGLEPAGLYLILIQFRTVVTTALLYM
jgi:hypothetical protein